MSKNVRFGSGTDIYRLGLYVRYTPNNGHQKPYVRLYEAVAVKAV